MTERNITMRQAIEILGMKEIAWLAGYPRSGAARIRTILVHCFGHQTASFYNEGYIGEDYQRTVRLLTWPLNTDDMERVAKEQGLLTVKTHQRPCDADSRIPTIVIVRDGRRTLESLRAFYHDRNEVDITVEQMIRGEHVWGSWSGWIRSWAIRCEPNALWLRYEDTMADVRGTVDRIAGRFDLQPIGYTIPPFEALREGTPGIFRKADVTSNGGLTPNEEDLFWGLHGATMTMLGYHR